MERDSGFAAEDGMSIGDTLAHARQDAGLSVTQVSQRTRIRETVIRGIENDDFAPCGGDFYARGHIRTVAAMVSADADPLIQEYDAAHGGIRQVPAAEIFGPVTPLKLRGRRQPNWSAAMGLVIVAVVIYGTVHACGSAAHQVSAAAHHKPVPVPAPAPPARRSAPEATPGQQHRPVLVQLAAAEGCWVGVYAAGGTLKWQAYIPAGAARSWVFAHRVSMKIGNPGGIVLTVNGHRMKSLGSQVATLNLQPGQTVPGLPPG
jgi:cytoskeletal protein RodZ